MTTTAFDDQFTPATQNRLRVNVIESQQQIHDQQTRLAAAIERAEKAEGELAELQATLAKLREQKPVAHIDYWKSDGTLIARRQETSGGKLYVAPVPAPHKGATHCGDCGLTWLDDGLNPLGCPYCKVSAPAPAVPADTENAK